MGTVSWTRGEGPLVPFAEGFWRELLRQGHPLGGAKHYLVLMGQLDCWLSGEGLAAGDLTPAAAGQFLASRRARGQRRVPTLASLAPLFGYLRNQQVLGPEQIEAATGQGELLARYRRYLLNDRGLAPGTVLRYERFARRFLAGRAARTGGETGAEGLTSAEVNAWMLEAGSRLTVESAKREAADLRALLPFLYLDGILAADLGGAMPPVAAWRGTRLPQTMSAADVDAVVGSCDRSTVSGRRDRAILVLLARLGLRSGEVAALRLGDVDWRAGEITVRGKARRTDRLPLLAEVGEALDRPGRPAHGHPALAGGGTVSAFAQHAGEYLRLRRALGHDLADAARLLPRFVAYLDEAGVSSITTEAALAWAQQPDAGPATSVWARRMTVARGFARYMSGIDPATEVPPLGLVTFRRHWRPPFIYSEADVMALIAAVPQLVPTPFRAATFQTMTGLLAATGMRVGEVIALGCGDIDWAEGVLAVWNSKFGKSREVPLHPTTVQALASYARFRDRHVPRPASPAFFISAKGTPVIYADFGDAFRKLVVVSGVGAGSPVSPRIHDLRHSFAVQTLIRWYRAGEDVGALLPRLSTYLGHLTPGYTYWYLSAAPELLALAATRLEKAKGVGR